MLPAILDEIRFIFILLISKIMKGNLSISVSNR
jgi:hypothetical protein